MSDRPAQGRSGPAVGPPGQARPLTPAERAQEKIVPWRMLLRFAVYYRRSPGCELSVQRLAAKAGMSRHGIIELEHGLREDSRVSTVARYLGGLGFRVRGFIVEDPRTDGVVVVGVTPSELSPRDALAGGAGAPVPGRPGYVTGRCGHLVAAEEWDAGHLMCEPCDGTRIKRVNGTEVT